MAINCPAIGVATSWRLYDFPFWLEVGTGMGTGRVWTDGRADWLQCSVASCERFYNKSSNRDHISRWIIAMFLVH